MKAPTFAPRKLDMGAFLESGEVFSGESPVSELPRLAEGLSTEVDLSTLPPVQWSAQGRLVPKRMAPPEQWLDLKASAELVWECQRCLQPVTETVEFDRSIRFAKNEEEAAKLDADSDDDVLALARNFDLIELIEDELIMAQPIVPRHDVCPTDVEVLMHNDAETAAPNSAPTPEPGAEEAPVLTASGRPNPFAVLAALKKGDK